MAKAFVQGNNSGGAPSGNPLTTVLGFSGSITAGNAVQVSIHQSSASVRTYTVVGSVAPTGWVQKLAQAAEGGPEIWFHPNHPGGAETITITHGSGSADFRARAAEFSGMGGTVAMVESDEFTDGVATTTHYCADTPGLTTALDVLGIAVAGIATTSGWTDCFPSGIWSSTEANVDVVMFTAYTIQPTGVTNERGQYSSTGTARVGRGVLAFFTGAASTAPTVTDVTPDTDLPAGGATVTITGTSFVATPAVTFDGVAATGEAWVSATEMTAVVPAHAEGLVTVRVTNPDTQYGELASAFLYDALDLPLPEVLQGPTGVTLTSGVTGDIALVGTTAGSRLIGVVIQTDANIRSYGVSDDVNGAYDSVLVYNPGRGVYVFEIRDNIGGDLTVTFTKTLGGSATSKAYILEVANLRTDIAPVLSTRIDSSNTTSHPGSAAPGMSTEEYPAFVLSASSVSGTLGAADPAAGYTEGSTGDLHYLQYKVAASGLLDDMAAWTSANSRIATSVQVAFYASSGEDPDPPSEDVQVGMFW